MAPLWRARAPLRSATVARPAPGFPSTAQVWQRDTRVSAQVERVQQPREGGGSESSCSRTEGAGRTRDWCVSVVPPPAAAESPAATAAAAAA